MYCYPSRLDGLGLTIVEAISCGLHVIVPDNAPMNEFVDEASGRLIAVDRLYARSDGYYWPQCKVNIQDFSKQIQFYLDNSDSIDFFKKSARQVAVSKFCWNSRKKDLIEVFLSAAYTFNEHYLSEVYSFEKKRSTKHWARSIFFSFPMAQNFLTQVFVK